MDQKEKENLSGCQEGGQGEQGHRGAENSTTNENSNQNQGNRSTLNRNEDNNQQVNVDWIDEADYENNARERSESLSSSSEHDDERNRVQSDRRQVINVIACISIEGIPHIHATYSFTEYVGGPGQVQGGLPLRLNGSNAHDYGRPRVNNGGDGGGPVQVQGGLPLRLNGSNAHDYGRPRVNNGEDRGNQDDYGGNNAGVGFDEMHGPPGFNGLNNRNDNGRIFYYVTTTAYAHLRRNGEGLSQMLSLRDSHIFNVKQATGYVNAIHQICNNIDLAEAMIAHLDCVKALLVRNMGLALTKQIACVNAVMTLLNDPYSRQEDWTYLVIHTVNFDLSILYHKATLPQ